MENRQPRLYWYPGNRRRKDILVFDPGYSQDQEMMGFYYVYGVREERGAADLEDELKQRGVPAMTWILRTD